jgi:hypothetical protein
MNPKFFSSTPKALFSDARKEKRIRTEYCEVNYFGRWRGALFLGFPSGLLYPREFQRNKTNPKIATAAAAILWI